MYPLSPGELYEVLSVGSNHRRGPDCLIKGYKPTVVSHGQGKQIAIRNLLGSQEFCGIEYLGIGKTDIVRPEAMVFRCFCHCEALQDRCYGQRIRIASARHDARGAIFRDRAGRPTLRKFSCKPSGGDGVTDMFGVEKRDHHIDIEQRTHSIDVLVAQPIDLLVCH